MEKQDSRRSFIKKSAGVFSVAALPGIAALEKYTSSKGKDVFRNINKTSRFQFYILGDQEKHVWAKKVGFDTEATEIQLILSLRASSEPDNPIHKIRYEAVKPGYFQWLRKCRHPYRDILDSNIQVNTNGKMAFKKGENARAYLLTNTNSPITFIVDNDMELIGSGYKYA